MKRKNPYSVIVLMAALLILVTACRFGAGSSDYTSKPDKFSVAFPMGPSDVKTETTSVKFAKSARTYSKSFDNQNPDFKSYEVEVLDLEPSQVAGKSLHEIQAIALNGWDKEKDTIVAYDIKFKGETGLDSSHGVTIGPISMWFREAVFYFEADTKLYVVRISASKKANVLSSEAANFINSFKLSKGWF